MLGCSSHTGEILQSAIPYYRAADIQTMRGGVSSSSKTQEMHALEKEKQEALIENYNWTISHASKEDWGELEAAPLAGSQMCTGSWLSWISGGGGGEEKPAESEAFWSNYDISKSVNPMLMPPEQYKAAKSIARALRVHLARKVRELKKFEVDRMILQRESLKIQTAWRRHDAARICQIVRDRVNRDQREQRAYDNFRTQLLGKGYRLMRWSHSKKVQVPCVVRVDRTREYFLFEQNFTKRKRYPIQEVKGVTKGYQSIFLKEYIVPKEPEKQLSIYFLDPKGKEEQISVDLLFDAFDKNKQDKAVGDSDGRLLRNRFYINFCKLQQELESDDAFFFNDRGVYCRVGRSVFERWERITMVDPNWDGTDQEQLRIRSQREKRERHLAQHYASKKRVAGAFHPLPLAQDEKPQAGDSNGVVNVIYAPSGSSSTRRTSYAATWFSWTEEIDYGANAAHLSQDFSKSSWAFRNPMLKEVFVLQRCLKKPGMDEFVPQFYHSSSSRKKKKRKSSSQGDGEKPVRARLTDLKPYFEDALKKIYGDVGIAGWRNSETGEFEFEDADWRRLCAIAKKIKFNKVAKNAAKFLEEAMDAEEEARRREEMRSNDGLGDNEGDEDNETVGTAATAAPVRNLTPLRKNLLRHMWREKDQCKDRMWRVSDLTYNTAQKNKQIVERRKEEQKAAEEKRLADERRRAALTSDSSLFNSDALYDSERRTTVSPGGYVDDRGEIQQHQQDVLHSEMKEDGRPLAPHARVIKEIRFRDGQKIDLAVLETSLKRKKHVPLGLKVGRLELRDDPLLLRGKKRDVRIECKAALAVHSLTDDAAPSISHAWQNQILAKRDLIVALNGKSPDSVDELIQLTKHSHKPRSITIFRLNKSKKEHHVGEDHREEDHFLTKLHECLHDPDSPLAEV